MKYSKFSNKQFFFYVQEKHGHKWTSIFKTVDSDEALALKEINETNGRAFRVLARLEEATA